MGHLRKITLTLQISIHQESTIASARDLGSEFLATEKDMVFEVSARKLRSPTRLSVELLILTLVFIFTLLIFLIIFSIGYLLPKRFESLLYLISCLIDQPVRI